MDIRWTRAGPRGEYWTVEAERVGVSAQITPMEGGGFRLQIKRNGRLRYDEPVRGTLRDAKQAFAGFLRRIQAGVLPSRPVFARSLAAGAVWTGNQGDYAEGTWPQGWAKVEWVSSLGAWRIQVRLFRRPIQRAQVEGLDNLDMAKQKAEEMYRKEQQRMGKRSMPLWRLPAQWKAVVSGAREVSVGLSEIARGVGKVQRGVLAAVQETDLVDLNRAFTKFQKAVLKAMDDFQGDSSRILEGGA